MVRQGKVRQCKLKQSKELTLIDGGCNVLGIMQIITERHESSLTCQQNIITQLTILSATNTHTQIQQLMGSMQ